MFRARDERSKIIGIAIPLMVGAVYLFLQYRCATIIPVVAIPVSLVCTLAILSLFGATIDDFSLFGLVVAVGTIVVRTSTLRGKLSFGSVTDSVGRELEVFTRTRRVQPSPANYPASSRTSKCDCTQPEHSRSSLLRSLISGGAIAELTSSA
jgi:hypothetical protein